MFLRLSILLLSGGLSLVLGETILGVTVFTRHGDRSSKHYSGYSLTNLGFQQNFQVGGDYRNIYLASNSSKKILGISEDKYVPTQIYSSAPDQMVLLNTATAFLQGLYPPLEGLDPAISSQTINNGSSYTNPLNGYQYVVLHGEDANSPDYVWIKGDDGCPVYTEASGTYEESTEYQTKMETTKRFYEGFWDILKTVYNYQPSNLTYANAFDIFDLINVATIHNTSVTQNVTSDQLFQLRTLADSSEFAHNYNATQPARSIGGQTFAGVILNQLNQTVSTKGNLKFSLLAGSYDTFLGFFGLANLTSASSDFFGLPQYASTMAFEILTEEAVTAFPADVSSVKVRFLFRNGSDDGAPLSAFPLFGGSKDTIAWSEFVLEMKKRAIISTSKWCSVCNSTQSFCAAYPTSTPAPGSTAGASTSGSADRSMSNAVAGVIGAMITLGVVIICAILAFFLLWRRPASHASIDSNQSMVEKGRASSESPHA